MTIKKKVKITIPNIFYINTETGHRRGFETQEKANDFIDSVEDPSIWDVEFREEYEKRYIENFERLQKENELTELDREILKYISYGNSKLSISKYLNSIIDDSYERLIFHGLIKRSPINFNDFQITESAKIVLAWSKEE